MKKIMFSALSMMIAFVTFGQGGVRLNLYGAYTFNDGFDVASDINTYYHGTVKGGAVWGAGLEYAYNPSGSAELMYLHRSTTVPTTFKFGAGTDVKNETFNLKHDYILLSGDGHYGHGGKVDGYGGLMLGVLFSNLEAPSQQKTASHTNFAWGGRLGANIWMSPKLGIKLQAQVLTSSKATGGSYYYSWYGPIYLNEYTTLWQFSLGGGLIFKLGK
jgi:hypothetical protein